MINVSERPAEAEDRAVPGHGEGDLVIGHGNQSAIGTLVERTTNYTLLLYLPHGYTPELVCDARTAKIQTLPDVLRASLAWDQGIEMRDWEQVRVDADIDTDFCASPSASALSVITVVPTSTSAELSVHRPELEIWGRATRMLVDQVRSIDVDHVVGDPVDVLTRDELAEVDLALAHYLGLQDVSPPRFS